MYQGPTYRRQTNPRQNASILSLVTFFFTSKILKRGFKNELEEEDIYDVLKQLKSTDLGDKFELEWKKEEVIKKPSLTRLIWRTYGKKYVLWGILRFCFKTYFTILQPLSVGKIVSYFSVPTNDITADEAYFYVFLLIFLFIFGITFHHTYSLFVLEIAQKIRIGLSSLIYRKSLKLSSSSVTDITNGKIVTLMSKDVMVFENVVQFTNDIWIGIIQIAIMTYVIYKQIGFAAFFGVGFLVALSPLQICLAKMTLRTKLKALAKSDERVRIIQEVLSAIQIIKMYTWETYFSRLVDSVRKKEMEKIKIIYYLKICILAIGHLSTRISFFICIITYTLLIGNITAEKAFVVLNCYGGMEDVLNLALPIGITQIAETKSALKRIKEFLLAEEFSDISNEVQVKHSIPKIVIKNLTVEIARNSPVLNNINLNLSTGLYGVTGEIGSGKSTLLKVFLKELPIKSGSLNLNGSVSYASQDPWLFPGTIRQNILFGLPYDSHRYLTVIKVCGLRTDLDILSRGDRTLVSDKGLSLSKGQQARVNLARAAYRNADVYLLDNPLAALDVTVSKQVFKDCIKDFLCNKLCILVTHQVGFLKQVDKIIIMKDGAIRAEGKYEDLEETGICHYKDDKENCASTMIPETKECNEDGDEQSALINPNDLHAEATKLYSEVKQVGKVDFRVYQRYFDYAGGFKTVPPLLLLLIASQVCSSGFDFFISYWINVEENLFVLSSNGTNTTEYQDFVDIKFNIPLYYLGLIIGVTMFTFGGSFMMFIIIGIANMRLHNGAFAQILKAPMAFFDINLSGNILNRFSKDIHTLDEIIPFLVFQCFKILFSLLSVSFIITTVKLEFMFFTLVFIALLYTLRRIYLPTSRCLKRLDGITRSPVVGHLNASLDGITTIRASGVQEILKSQFDRHQDLHSSSAYMYLVTNIAFGMWIDVLSGVYCAVIIVGLFIFPGATSGQAGLAISQSFSLSDILQFGMRQWAELENQMTSVERIMEYTETEGENTSGKTPDDWPKQGKLAYRNVHLRYPKTKDLVLKNVSFAAAPKQKIAIIGRTGAGKTSLVSSLFRLYDTEDGSIKIDDCDIRNINVEHLRSHMSIIPQNPVLFSGTLRTNLDPKGQHADADLWRALKEVEMETAVSKLESKLECEIKEGDAVFSTGQKQLICLARAVLLNNKIIVFDEATANVDPQTDKLIQNTISRNFSECTVLTIAHKLDSVLGAEKVMVMSNGGIVEFNEPNNLLKDQNSAFYYLVSQSGLLM